MGNNINKRMKADNGNIKGVCMASWNRCQGLINNGIKTSKMIEVEEYMMKNKVMIITLTETDLHTINSRTSRRTTSIHRLCSPESIQ